MIPKIIHYVWLGDTMPSELNQYISTWKALLPDYRFVRWSMDNWKNEEKYPFVKECLKNQMYAHASDVIRMDVLYAYGGIYLDTDVSLHQSFDSLLDSPLFLGRIYRNLLGTAVIGAEKNNRVIAEILEMYKNLTVQEVLNGKRFDTNNSTLTYFFLDHYSEFKLENINQTMKDGTLIFKKEYFEQPSIDKATNFAVHHYMGSWRRDRKSLFEKAKIILKLVLPPYLYGQISSRRGAKKNFRFDEYKALVNQSSKLR